MGWIGLLIRPWAKPKMRRIARRRFRSRAKPKGRRAARRWFRLWSKPKEAPSGLRGLVTVPDGDGLTVGERGAERRYRLWGIDAPEFPRQPFGYEAREKLIALVAQSGAPARGGKVWLKGSITVREIGTDKYGRVLVVLRDGETNINEKLVEAGLAWAYLDDGRFAAAQQAAKAARIGVHKPGLQSVPPWEWRRRHPPKGRRTPAPVLRRRWPWVLATVAAGVLLALLLV